MDHFSVQTQCPRPSRGRAAGTPCDREGAEAHSEARLLGGRDWSPGLRSHSHRDRHFPDYAVRSPNLGLAMGGRGHSERHCHNCEAHGCVPGTLPEASTLNRSAPWETVWSRGKEHGLRSQAAWAPFLNPLLTGWVTAGKSPNLSVPPWLHP